MTNENETVLVTGGSGFIATHCILKLAAAGYKIKSTVRNLDRVTDLNDILVSKIVRMYCLYRGNHLIF